MKEITKSSSFDIVINNSQSEIYADWARLNERQQKFLMYWYENGFNGTEAYMKAYGQKKKNIARVCACQVLTNPNILKIRKYIQFSFFPPIEKVAFTLNELLSNKNPRIRLSACASVLKHFGKLDGEYKNDEHKNPFEMDSNTKKIVAQNIEALKGILN